MEDSAPGHDAVRAYLDAAVAEAAERWVGRAADATAYADLVAAVLARREALSPMAHLPLHHTDPPPPVQPGARHHERRARPRWPLGPVSLVASEPVRPAPVAGPPAGAPHTPAYPSRSGPFSAPLDVPSGTQLPNRPPGRHRAPAELLPPQSVDLTQNLHTVLDWLGRPDA